MDNGSHMELGIVADGYLWALNNRKSEPAWLADLDEYYIAMEVK